MRCIHSIKNFFPKSLLENNKFFCPSIFNKNLSNNFQGSSLSLEFSSSFSISTFPILNKKKFLIDQFFNKRSIRALHLHEYQSKDLLRSFGLNVQKGKDCDNAEKAKLIAKQFKEEGAKELIIKCQVLTGGRGKGVLSSGLKGGVQICKNEEEVYEYAQQMLNYKIHTHQTTEEGELVKKVLVHEGVDILKELYIAIVLDRNANSPVFIVSEVGGIDIEEVARSDKEKVKCVPIDIVRGLDEAAVNEVVKALNVCNFRDTDGKEIDEAARKNLEISAARQVEKMYKLFCEYDCLQLEINPLAVTRCNDNMSQQDYKVICVDAKLQFDDNASFRHKDLFAMEDKSCQDAREVLAETAGLNFVGMKGNIGCLVNGAGLAMATMDIIKLHGGNPANFLDVGGGADVNQVTEAFKILQSDSQVCSIFVNIFGGIMRCDIIAKGLVAAAKETNLNLPLVVRLCGNKVEDGREILEKSGIKCHVIEDFDEAARKVCSFAKN